MYRFQAGRAVQCAQSWLRTELDLAVKEGAKFIVVLGRNAQSWVQQQMSDEVRNRGIPLIHPSGQNAAVWARTQVKGEKIRVRHEQLIAETGESVRKILEFAGFDYSATNEGDKSRTV